MKQFLSVFLRWLLVNLVFVAITIISAGFSALPKFALAIPAAGFIYLLLFGFVHSKRKGIIIGAPLMLALVAAILQFFPLAKNDSSLWFFIYPAVGILLALDLNSRFVSNPLTKKDALLLIAMVAVLNGIIYLIFGGDFFWSLRLITIFGYSSAAVFLIIIFGLKPVTSGIKWLFGYTKKSATSDFVPPANSTN